MYTFLARQPIFDHKYNVYGYELLYREAEKSLAANIIDGNAATRRVLSDAITLFGLDTLTNSKPAFINFTGDLILEEFPCLVDPGEIVVELLEDVKITPQLIEKISDLKKKGYTIALDDFVGLPCFEGILPYVDIVKVDFMLTDREKQERIAKKLSNDVILLAEKVETNEEYEWAKSIGYKLFQGYFFSRPVTYKKKVQKISSTTFLMLMAELKKDEVDFRRCAEIIRADTVLTYRMLKKMQTLEYYRGGTVNNVENAIVMMGVSSLWHWLILVVAQDNNRTRSDELTRSAFLRGLFAEELVKKSARAGESSSAFLLGMFSLLDRILDESQEKLLEDIVISKDVKDALLGRRSNFFSELLDFIIDYEKQNRTVSLYDLGIRISDHELHKLYAQCVANVDDVFKEG